MRDRDLGIVYDYRTHKMNYGWRHGEPSWAPRWLQRAIVCSWNMLACRVWGHYYVPADMEKPPGALVCVDCSKKAKT